MEVSQWELDREERIKRLSKSVSRTIKTLDMISESNKFSRGLSPCQFKDRREGMVEKDWFYRLDTKGIGKRMERRYFHLDMIVKSSGLKWEDVRRLVSRNIKIGGSYWFPVQVRAIKIFPLFDSTGEEWPNASEAARYFRVYRNAITTAITKKYRCKGRFWSSVSVEDAMRMEDNPPSFRRVNFGGFLRVRGLPGEYKTFAEAALSAGCDKSAIRMAIKRGSRPSKSRLFVEYVKQEYPSRSKISSTMAAHKEAK